MRLRRSIVPVAVAVLAARAALVGCGGRYGIDPPLFDAGLSVREGKVSPDEDDTLVPEPTVNRDDGGSGGEAAPREAEDVPPCLPGSAAQQTRSPRSVVTVTSLQNVNGGTISSPGLEWMTPESATASDDRAATVVLSQPTKASASLVLTNFGFQIPLGARIDGIRYDVERRASELDAVEDLDVRPLVLGRAVLSVQLARNEPFPNFDGMTSYGGLGASFGVNWTAERINDVGFGMAFRAWSIVESSTPTAYVDAMSTTVFYTCP